MKKKIFYLFSVFIILFGACSDTIFYDISLEEKILEPRIKGSPANFAEFNSVMYTASGTVVWSYNGQWGSSRPGGSVLALAATSTRLYALCVESDKTRIMETSNGVNWSETSISANYTAICNIYSANDNLIIGAKGTGEYYCILSLTGNIEDTGNMLLNGAVYESGNYYLSLKDQVNESGDIQVTSSLTLTPVSTLSIPSVGIINIGTNNVYAISRDGTLYDVKTKTSIASFGGNYRATGALASWKEGANELLLAGRQDVINQSITTGYTYGYLEIPVISGTVSGSFNEPGLTAPTTVILGENGRYRSTIGKMPVNHIYQAPDGVLFASTQKNGVWSLRYRKGIYLWNAEE